MASQKSGFPPIDFSISTPFQHVRLMEVGDDLLQQIESSRKDGGTARLKFKSSPQSASATSLSGNLSSGIGKDGILHLCSDEKSWAVKQVSTSNTVYLIQPSASASILEDDNEDTTMQNAMEQDPKIPMQSETVTSGHISATSKIGSFLELQHVKVDEKEIEEYIRTLVPSYEQPLMTNVRLLESPKLRMSPTLDNLLNDIPAPDSIIRLVCSKVCVFEIASDRGVQVCHIPTAGTLLKVWSNVVEGCAIESVKLDGPIQPERIAHLLNDEAHRAIAQAMFRTGGMLDALNVVETTIPRTLKPAETTLFVASLMLSAQKPLDVYSESQTRPAEEFLQSWYNLVPTSFMKYCTLESLSFSDMVTLSKNIDGNDVLGWKHSNSKQNVLMPSSDKASTAGLAVANEAAKPATVGKRKWHEKLGAQRNAKR